MCTSADIVAATNMAGSMILPDFKSAKQPSDVNESHGTMGWGPGVGGRGAGGGGVSVKQ